MKKNIRFIHIGLAALICFIGPHQSTFAVTWTKQRIQQAIIEESHKSTHVTPALALAIAEIESDFRAKPISPKGAVGIMQIMPLTAKTVFNVPRYKLFNPTVNIRLGVTFLDQLITRYHGRIDLALSHYNGGSKVGAWPNSRIIPATKPYVRKVLIAAKKSRKLIPNMNVKLRNAPRYVVSTNNQAHQNDKWKFSLKDAEYWLKIAKNSGYSGGHYGNSKNFELNHLHKKMETNRHAFRHFLKNG